MGDAGDTGCYRFKSERRRIRDKKEHRDKQLLKLDRELGALYHQRRNLPEVPFDPPVQRGWVRYFVLREDVARSKDASFFEGILARINTETYCYRKDFKRKKRRKGMKPHDPQEQRVRKLYEWEFRKANFTSKEKSFFEERIGIKERQITRTYHFKEKWRYVMTVRPRTITKVIQYNPELECRIKKLERTFSNYNLKGRLYHLKGHRDFWWKPDFPIKEKYEYQNTPLHATLGMIDTAACTEQNERT